MTDDLVTWLRAALDEDERVARAASPSPWTLDEQSGRGEVWADITAANRDAVCDTESGALGPSLDTARHLFRWQPARVLAEVEAKRRILDLYEELYEPGLYEAVALLALPCADRPGYQEAWRP